MPKKEKEKNKTEIRRSRLWSFLVYPESAKTGWVEFLKDNASGFVSPLHNKDFWTIQDEEENAEHKSNTSKKEHYHVLIISEGNKSYNQIKDLSEHCSGVSPVMIANKNQMTRYLTHKDNPEKAQYLDADVISFGAVDYTLCIVAQKDDIYMVREMQQFIRSNCIVSFSDFCDYCADNREDWYNRLINKNAYIIKEYIKSKTYTLMEEAYLRQAQDIWRQKQFEEEARKNDIENEK